MSDPRSCAACPSALVTRVELTGGVCEDCLAAEARRHRDETGGWVAPNVRDLRERVRERGVSSSFSSARPAPARKGSP